MGEKNLQVGLLPGFGWGVIREAVGSRTLLTSRSSQAVKRGLVLLGFDTLICSWLRRKA